MRKILLIYLIWRSLLIIVANLSAFIILPKFDFLGKQFAQDLLGLLFWHWANFDGEHYLWIAKNGYREFEYAFFPVFPLIIRATAFITHNVLLSGLLVTTLSSFLLLLILYKLFLLDFKENIVFLGLILFLSFPAAFFLVSIYSESFFLCLVASSLLAARKKKFFLASMLGIIASATRLVGIFLIPALLLIWMREMKDKRPLFFISLVPLGLIFVIIFNWLQAGDPLNFIHVQPGFGAGRSGTDLILLPQVIYRYFKIFITVSPLSYSFFISFQEFILTIFVFGTLITAVKKIRPEYLLFSLGAILTPTLTGTFSSMPRYVLAAFPIFFILASIIRHKLKVWLMVFFMFLLEILNVVLFINGYWVS